MKKEILILGIAGLLGCDNSKNFSRISENVNLTKPEGCITVKDIRYEVGYKSRYYQLLCNDSEGDLTLYYREGFNNSAWQKINVK